MLLESSPACFSGSLPPSLYYVIVFIFVLLPGSAWVQEGSHLTFVPYIKIYMFELSVIAVLNLLQTLVIVLPRFCAYFIVFFE
jgi:hypothetical protein